MRSRVNKNPVAFLALLLEIRVFPPPHFHGCGFFLRISGVEVRDPTANTPPQPFTLQPPTALNGKVPVLAKLYSQQIDMKKIFKKLIL